MRRLVAAAWAFVDTLTGSQVFPKDGDSEPMTEGQWAALLILHAEAIHGCEHTAQARSELGIHGPRGKAAA